MSLKCRMMATRDQQLLGWLVPSHLLPPYLPPSPASLLTDDGQVDLISPFPPSGLAPVHRPLQCPPSPGPVVHLIQACSCHRPWPRFSIVLKLQIILRNPSLDYGITHPRPPVTFSLRIGKTETSRQVVVLRRASEKRPSLQRLRDQVLVRGRTLPPMPKSHQTKLSLLVLLCICL